MTGSSIRKFGLIVNPLVPWLGYSNDGVLETNGAPSILKEMKSPEERENLLSEEVDCSKDNSVHQRWRKS